MIIGAGIAGLIAGIPLIQQGYSVVILEKHSNPGGYCTNFTRKGFNFDSSIQMLNGCTKGGMISLFSRIERCLWSF